MEVTDGLYLYQVGKPFNPGRSNWPEGAQYNYREGQHELVLFYHNLRPYEIQAVETGIADFALWEAGDLMVLLYRFRSKKLETLIPWSEAFFSIWRVQEDQRKAPPKGLAANERPMVYVFLVDAGTGILKAMRAFTWSPTFTAHVHATIFEQLKRGYPENYDEQVNRYLETTNTQQILAKAIARTKGGD